MCTRAVVRSRAAGRGNILARCVLRRLAVAINCSDAFSDALPRQFSRFMHPRRGLGREKRPSLAAYRRCASKTSWLWQDMRAMHPKSAANHRWRIHHAHILPGRGPFRCTDPSDHTWGANLAREPHRTGPPRIMHGARILLSLASERERIRPSQNADVLAKTNPKEKAEP